MAKKPLITDSTLDALLAKGHISSDLYDKIKSEDDKDKALKKEAKQAEQDFRIAENSIPGPANDPFNLGLNGQRPSAPPVASDATSTQPTPPTLPATEATAPPAPVSKVGVPTSQVVGGQAPAPQAPIGPPAPPTTTVTPFVPGPNGQASVPVVKPTAQPQTLQQRVAGGAYNPYGGPTDQEKFLTPGERARKTELVEEGKLKGDIVGRSTALGMKEDKQIADLFVQKTQEYQAMVDAQAKIRADENTIVQDNLNKLTAESKALSQMKIDPNRAWSNLSTGSKILAGIGMFIGAGGTRKGGANPAVEQINKAIDRDIAAQEFDIKNKAGSITQRAGLLQERMKQFGNLELARQAAKKDALDIAEMQVKTLMAGNKAEKTQLAGDELLANIQEAKNKTMFEFSQLNDQRARQLAAQAAARQAAANAKLYEDYKARRDALLKVNEERIKAGLAPLDPEQMAGVKSYDYQPSDLSKSKDLRERTVEILGPDGKPRVYVGRDNKAADAIGEAEIAKQRLKALIKEAKELRAEHGGELFPTAAKKRMQQINGEMLAEVKTIDKLGTLDAGVERLGEKIIPDLTDWNIIGEDTVLTQLDGLEKKADRNLDIVLRSNAVPGSMPATPSQLGATENKKVK